MKKTAIEWLIEEMSKYGYAHTFKLYQRQVEQAKAMEKEQKQRFNKFLNDEME